MLTVDMMGLQGDDWQKNKDTLVEAAAAAGVKVYIPSEFGTNHHITNYRDMTMFQTKAHHFEEAKTKIPKVVGIFTSLMMEQSFIKWLGFDNETEVWQIVGKGDVPVSLTAREDVGRFTIEAAIMAYQEPDKVPDKVIISTVTKTLADYAATLDKYAKTGNKIKLEGKSLEEAKAHWEEIKDTIPVGMVLSELALTNYSSDLYCRLSWLKDISIIPRTVPMRFSIPDRANGNSSLSMNTQRKKMAVLGSENNRFE